jgi:hypothetical protein
LKMGAEIGLLQDLADVTDLRDDIGAKQDLG